MKAHVDPAGFCEAQPGDFYLMLCAIAALCLVILLDGGPGAKPAEADFGDTSEARPVATHAIPNDSLTAESGGFAERFYDLVQRTEGY
jgi:hypothetical protein